MKRVDILEHRTEIEQWISEKRSKAFIRSQLHCKNETLNKYLGIMGIQYAGNKGTRGHHKTSGIYIPLIEYLNEPSETIKTSTVHKKLLREGYKKHECEKCMRTTWMGEPIPLELHHIDGNRRNNSITNLVLICPNCHAQTDSYRGKNKNRYT